MMLNLKYPEVVAFQRAAAAHLDAAIGLIELCSDRSTSTRAHDAVYLVGYVAECALKALLLSVTPRKRHEQLMQWFKAEAKHNLDRLKRELSRRKVEIPKRLALDFSRVRGAWSSEMRYHLRRWKRDDAELVIDSTERLFEWIQRG